MGFAQEIKDFLGSAAAGQKIIGAAGDQEYSRTKNKYLQAQIATILAKNKDDADPEGNAQRAADDLHTLSVASANQRNALAAHYKALGLTPPAALTDADAAAPTTKPGALPTAAVPAAPAPAAPAAPQVVGAVQPDPAEEAAGIPTQGAAVGGPIKHFAAGGAVVADGPDKEDDDDADDPVRVAAIGPGAAASPSASGPGFSPQAAQDAVTAGEAYGMKHFGLDQVAALRTPAQQLGARARAAGAHAAPLEDMTKLKKAVDPEGKMGESTRNLAAIGALYQYKMNKGDTEGAARTAFQMIQHYRVASDKYAAIAAVAGQKGDVDTMTHAAMKAYANIPDGKNFTVQKTPDGQLQYSFTDDHGNVISKGIEPPQKLAAAAMGMVQGNGFDAALNDRAGVPQPKQPAGPKPLKVSDKTSLLKSIDAAYEPLNPEDPNDAKKTKYSPDDQTLHKAAALRMVAHPKNDTMTPEEATQVAVKISDPSVPDKEGFSPKKVDGGYEVAFGKRKTFVPEDDFDGLMARRTEALKAQDAKDDAEEDANDGRSDFVRGALDKVSKGYQAILDWNTAQNARAKAKIAAKGAVPAAPPQETDYNQPQP